MDSEHQEHLRAIQEALEMIAYPGNWPTELHPQYENDFNIQSWMQSIAARALTNHMPTMRGYLDD